MIDRDELRKLVRSEDRLLEKLDAIVFRYSVATIRTNDDLVAVLEDRARSLSTILTRLEGDRDGLSRGIREEIRRSLEELLNAIEAELRIRVTTFGRVASIERIFEQRVHRSLSLMTNSDLLG